MFRLRSPSLSRSFRFEDRVPRLRVRLSSSLCLTSPFEYTSSRIWMQGDWRRAQIFTPSHTEGARARAVKEAVARPSEPSSANRAN